MVRANAAVTLLSILFQRYLSMTVALLRPETRSILCSPQQSDRSVHVTQQLTRLTGGRVADPLAVETDGVLVPVQSVASAARVLSLVSVLHRVEPHQTVTCAGWTRLARRYSDVMHMLLDVRTPWNIYIGVSE